MLGMVVLLTPAIWEIADRHTRAIQKTFVQKLSRLRIWASWSRDLNLQENNAKRQYFHPQHKGRQEFIDFGIPASQVSHDILILGHGFKGFVCTAKNYQQRS